MSMSCLQVKVATGVVPVHFDRAYGRLSMCTSAQYQLQSFQSAQIVSKIFDCASHFIRRILSWRCLQISSVLDLYKSSGQWWPKFSQGHLPWCRCPVTTLEK
jgi:hypothetical protein